MNLVNSASMFFAFMGGYMAYPLIHKLIRRRLEWTENKQIDS